MEGLGAAQERLRLLRPLRARVLQLRPRGQRRVRPAEGQRRGEEEGHGRERKRDFSAGE